MDSYWISLVSLVISSAVIILLIMLYRKGIISPEAITATGELIDGIHVENSFITTLAYYCGMAVKAVDQMVKNGTIPKEDQARKEAAVDYVTRFAAVDGYELTPDEQNAIEMLIEAKVHEMHEEAKAKPPENAL